MLTMTVAKILYASGTFLLLVEVVRLSLTFDPSETEADRWVGMASDFEASLTSIGGIVGAVMVGNLEALKACAHFGAGSTILWVSSSKLLPALLTRLRR